MTALKPCPFCGADASQHYDFVSCSTNCVATECSTIDCAVSAWNTRPPLATEEELQALRDASGDLTDEADRLWRMPLQAMGVETLRSRAAILSALERRLRGVE